MLADANSADFASSGANRFRALFSQGYQLYTNSAGTIGVQVLGKGGSWSSISDRNVKQNIMAIDPIEFAHRVAQMPIAMWTYIDDEDNVPHLGPMAQDFYDAFGLGNSDRHIATMDADGVLFAAVQGLHQIMEERDAEIAALHERVARLEAMLSTVLGMKEDSR